MLNQAEGNNTPNTNRSFNEETDLNEHSLGFKPTMLTKQIPSADNNRPEIVGIDAMLKASRGLDSIVAPDFLTMARDDEKNDLSQSILERFFKKLLKSDGFIGAVEIDTDYVVAVSSIYHQKRKELKNKAATPTIVQAAAPAADDPLEQRSKLSKLSPRNPLESLRRYCELPACRRRFSG